MVRSDSLIKGDGLIALITDFGTTDAYVASMKAVILNILPGARLIDISHHVRPQDVFHASYLLETSLRYFPEGTTFLCVVDPGVGTARRRVALKTGQQLFVAPDNGCLSAALSDDSRGKREAEEEYRIRPRTLDSSTEAVAIEAEKVGAHNPSATFEGRDVFAPTAALLASGATISGLGEPLASIDAFPALVAPAGPEGPAGLVIHVDAFGNLISDITAASLPSGALLRYGDQTIPLVRTYAEADGLAALVGSSGFVEVALPGGRADRALGAQIGDRLTLLA